MNLKSMKSLELAILCPNIWQGTITKCQPCHPKSKWRPLTQPVTTKTKMASATYWTKLRRTGRFLAAESSQKIYVKTPKNRALITLHFFWLTLKNLSINVLLIMYCSIEYNTHNWVHNLIIWTLFSVERHLKKTIV